jgi:cyclic pyranopterin monophosphate synthase
MVVLACAGAALSGCFGADGSQFDEFSPLFAVMQEFQQSVIRHFDSAEMPKKLSHYGRDGRAKMVDVSAKAVTQRTASASAFVAMKPAVLRALPNNPKGDPLEVARLAGIMAAKKTSELIPMCHPIALSHVAVDITVCENGVGIASRASTRADTGVEMEALVAASVAALTVYDMCKALDKGIEIREVVLTSKTGGKSGDYRRTRSRAKKT